MGWDGIERNGVEWSGVGEIRLGLNWIVQIARDWVGLGWIAFWSGFQNIGLDRIGLEWVGLDESGLERGETHTVRCEGYLLVVGVVKCDAIKAYIMRVALRAEDLDLKHVCSNIGR